MDRAVWLGVVGGGLTALSALVGYFGIPLVTGTLTRASILMSGLDTFRESTAIYHILVLGVPSLLATVGGILLARREGLAGRWVDGKLLAGNVLAPVALAIWLFELRVFIIGGIFAVGGFLQVGVSESILQTVLSLLGSVLTFHFTVFMGLLLGGLVTVSQVLPTVLLTVSAGTLGGYLLARAITHSWTLDPDCETR
jgi:hypothetical protein